MANPTFAQSAANTTATTATTTHSVTANVSATTNGIGCFFLERNDGGTTDVWTTVTWGGVSMTAATAQISVGVRAIKMYYVTAPASGASVTISATSSVPINARIWWGTIQNAFQGAPEATNTETNSSGTDGELSVTTLTDNALVVGMGSYIAASAVTAVSGTTNRMNHLNLWVWWTAPKTPAGAISSGNTLTSSTNNQMIVAAWAPEVSNLANLKTLDGIAKANIKTIDGIAIANVKTYNGIA